MNWLTRWRQWYQRRREQAALAQQQAVYATLIARWERKNWWRFVPAEGWQIGYNTTYLPYEAKEHFEKHGQFLPITAAEIHNATGVPIPFIRSYYQHGR